MISDAEEELTVENMETLENLKAELYELRKEKVKGAVIRSRAKNMLEGEQELRQAGHYTPMASNKI